MKRKIKKKKKTNSKERMLTKAIAAERLYKRMYQFPSAAVGNYHNPSGFKQQKFVLSQF